MADPAQQSAEAAGRARGGGRKSAAAFRTISEVAGELDVAQHVLRFWESKFPQVRPLKRGGGRRYYRPEDVDLLRQIRSLLYDEGYTIKGAQKLLRSQRRGGGEGHENGGAGAHPSAARPSHPAAEEEFEAAEAADPVGHEVAALPPVARERLRRLRDELLSLREALRETLG